MGEFELLARVRERLPPAGPRVRIGMGDDAAVTVPGGATATSVVLVTLSATGSPLCMAWSMARQTMAECNPS